MNITFMGIQLEQIEISKEPLKIEYKVNGDTVKVWTLIGETLTIMK